MSTGDYLFGYSSNLYERVETLAEDLTYAAPDQEEKALREYLRGLQAISEMRTRAAKAPKPLNRWSFNSDDDYYDAIAILEAAKQKQPARRAA